MDIYDQATAREEADCREQYEKEDRLRKINGNLR